MIGSIWKKINSNWFECFCLHIFYLKDKNRVKFMPSFESYWDLEYASTMHQTIIIIGTLTTTITMTRIYSISRALLMCQAVLFAPMTILFDVVNTDTPGFFWLMFAWCIFSILWVYIYLFHDTLSELLWMAYSWVTFLKSALTIFLLIRIYEKRWDGRSTSWNQDCRGTYQ